MKKHIPARDELYCDGCGAKEGVTGRFHKSASLHLNQAGLDFQGMAVGPGSRQWDLCDGCAGVIEDAIDDALKQLKQKRG